LAEAGANDELPGCPGVVPWRIFVQVVINWAVVVFVHMLLSGTSGGLVKLLVEFAQLALLLAPDTEANAVLQLLNVHIPSLSGCSFPTDYYGMFVQRLATPLVSVGQLLAAFGVLAVFSRLFTGRWPDRARWLWTPAVSLLISVYEPLTDAAFGMLRCTDAAGFSVLAEAPAFDCASPRHAYYASIATGVVVAVTTLFPLALIIILAALRKRLNDDPVRSRIGLLYGEYRPTLWFWLIVSLLRRTLLVGIQLVPSEQLPSLISLLIVAAFFIAHRWLHPLEHSVGNVLQEISFFSLLLVAAGNAIVSFGLGIEGLQPVSLGIQYFIAVLVLCTLLLMLVITLWSMRETIYATWIVFRSGLQLAQHRGRQLSLPAARPSPSGTRLLREPLMEKLDDPQVFGGGKGSEFVGDQEL
jgi:hypothetical protein